jgi:hypothetical protein
MGLRIHGVRRLALDIRQVSPWCVTCNGAARRAADAQMPEVIERLIAAWNGRQVRWTPMLFAPTIGAALAARRRFLWVRCPACRTTPAVDVRVLAIATPARP